MEGVTDAPMRDFLCGLGGFTYCVTEFYRISQDVPTPRAIKREVPELEHQCKTRSGVPVQVQFLGGHPERLAQAAQNAVAAGAQSIDLNFGCPAPTVNRHDGGATLLKFPERIEVIVRTVRMALPEDIAVSAKLRLGWDDANDIHRNAEACARGGANWITIHARTRMQGYRPPAYWAPIAQVKSALDIPVVVNGEIWTIQDFRRAREQSGCEHFMLGRGALANPHLASAISLELGLARSNNLVSTEWPKLINDFINTARNYGYSNGYALCRIKQWMRFARHLNNPLFESIKNCQSLEEVTSSLV